MLVILLLNKSCLKNYHHMHYYLNILCACSCQSSNYSAEKYACKFKKKYKKYVYQFMYTYKLYMFLNMKIEHRQVLFKVQDIQWLSERVTIAFWIKTCQRNTNLIFDPGESHLYKPQI